MEEGVVSFLIAFSRRIVFLVTLRLLGFNPLVEAELRVAGCFVSVVVCCDFSSTTHIGPSK